ncbi:hypothetical protein VTJ83DRAFT_4718 [Remersonia thermophila]|uniref:Major facilitator superfamily (MFS) profile domain-containing protein n=1 Tax=Remersonia thermophila TaxID=72144 RepID=A0ABR4DC80_9PEZI
MAETRRATASASTPSAGLGGDGPAQGPQRLPPEEPRGPGSDSGIQDGHGHGQGCELHGQPPGGRLLRRRRLDGSRRETPLYTPDEERAVVRLLDRRLVLFLALLYMLSFLDRSNIGNARIAGMDEDLQSDPPYDGWYEWSLGAFYVTYIAFEWMSLLWRVIPAHIYVSALVLSWGVVASLQAVAVNYPMLIVLRALLGIGEAGFTAVPFYLSFFFRRDELAFRTAIFISAFASSLAWLILKLGSPIPIAPWRLLFLIEGFPSVFAAIAAWYRIPDSPDTAPFLSRRQKLVARLRLRAPSSSRQDELRPPPPPPPTPLLPRSRAGRVAAAVRGSLAVLKDPAAWLTAAILFLTNMAYASLPVFLPSIIRDMGYRAVEAQALSAPPYLVAFGVALITAYASDKMGARSPLLIARYALLALSPHPPLSLPPSHPLRYLALYPAAVGFFSVVVLTLAWAVNNQPSAARRGAAFALLQVLGQCGPLVGTRLFPERQAPYYATGMAVCAGGMAGVAVLAVALRGWLARVNARWDKEEEEDLEEGEEEQGEEQEEEQEEEEEEVEDWSGEDRDGLQEDGEEEQALL